MKVRGCDGHDVPGRIAPGRGAVHALSVRGGSLARHAYRIVHEHYPPFDGGGACRWGSRWIGPGRWVIHAAETYALAVLENLVHWQTSALPPRLVCVRVTIPVGLEQERIEEFDCAALTANDFASTRALGNQWYDRGRTSVLWVPSAVSPYESNVLFNQRHGDFPRIEAAPPISARVDPRLTR